MQTHARKAWNGLEREAVIEIVRSADYAAYIIQNSSDDESLDGLRLILTGIAPALATFLPLMDTGKGLPFRPATPQIVGWTDSMLLDFGRPARLQKSRSALTPNEFRGGIPRARPRGSDALLKRSQPTGDLAAPAAGSTKQSTGRLKSDWPEESGDCCHRCFGLALPLCIEHKLHVS